MGLAKVAQNPRICHNVAERKALPCGIGQFQRHGPMGLRIALRPPDVGVDVGEGGIEVRLGEAVEAFPFGEDVSDQLVVPLRLRLVVGPHRPRVEGLDGDSAAGHRLLDLPVVVELGPVVGEAGLHRERLARARLRDGPHRLEDGLPGRFRPAFVYEQPDLEVGLRPGDGENRLRILGFADDGVELAGGGLRVGGDVVEVVLMHPPKKLPHVGDDEAPGFFAPGEAPLEPDVPPELMGLRREKPVAQDAP